MTFGVFLSGLLLCDLLPVKLRHNLLRLQQVRRRWGRHSPRQNLPPKMLPLRKLWQDLPHRGKSNLHWKELPLHGLRKATNDDKQRDITESDGWNCVAVAHRTAASRCVGSDSKGVDSSAERLRGREPKSWSCITKFCQWQMCRMCWRAEGRASSHGSW